MQIVIYIPEEMYQNVLNGTYCGTLYEELKKGTPLPKGHGDIVDIETLINMFWVGNSMEITKYDLSVIEPIIKADKESEDKE